MANSFGGQGDGHGISRLELLEAEKRWFFEVRRYGCNATAGPVWGDPETVWIHMGSTAKNDGSPTHAKNTIFEILGHPVGGHPV